VEQSPIVREYIETGRSEACPIIDMHGHLGPYAGAYLPSAPIDRMLATLTRCGVKTIICAPHIALWSDTVEGNLLMQSIIHAYPGQFLGYWTINPNFFKHMDDNLQLFHRTKGFVGFKLLPDYHTIPVTSPLYAPALELANREKLLVLVHTWGGSPFNSPQLVSEVAELYPDAIFLMGHSGYGDWEASTTLARDLPNVYLDLTAVYIAHDFSMQPAGSGTPQALPSCLSVNGVIEYMVERATSRKIVFGTDLPWYSPHFAAGSVLFAHITDGDRHNILHINAEGLLKSYINPGFVQSGAESRKTAQK
jgi:predicted TIM-barrel fold metal-dependent hydrolase